MCPVQTFRHAGTDSGCAGGRDLLPPEATLLSTLGATAPTPTAGNLAVDLI